MCGVYGDGPRLIPEKLMQDASRPEKTIARVAGSHEQEWARACKAGKKAGAAFEYSGPLTEICLLGNVAKRLDTRIVWDAANLRVTNNPEAETLIRRPYRPGWTPLAHAGRARDSPDQGRGPLRRINSPDRLFLRE